MSLSEFSKPYYSPEEIASIVRDCGYKAELEQLPDGRKAIRSSASGHSFSIYLYGADEQIRSIQFVSIFSKTTLENTNRWNSEKRFIKAYCDSEGDLWLEWDVVTTFVAPAFFKECIEFWDALFAQAAQV